jgi:ribosomal-protein-alanine N-acetyltransferase
MTLSIASLNPLKCIKTLGFDQLQERRIDALARCQGPLLIDEKVRKVALKMFVGAFCGIAVGCGVSFLFSGVPILAIVVIGAGVGLFTRSVIAIAQRYLSQEPTAFSRTIDGGPLDRIAQHCKGKPVLEQAERTVRRMIEQVNQQRPIHLRQSFDNHTFHHAVTLLTEEAKKQPGLIKTWGTFLQGLQGMPVNYPDGRCVPLDFSLELQRLNGIQVTIQTEKLNPFASNFCKTVHQICKVEEECFTGNGVWTEQALQDAFRSPNGHCIVARRKETGEVLGFLWYMQKQGMSGRPDWHICGVGRTADSARLGIGESLFKEFMKQIFPDQEGAYLQVRASNEAAIALYKRYGFNVVQRERNYYEAPLEDALIMRFNYAAYLAQTARSNAA